MSACYSGTVAGIQPAGASRFHTAPTSDVALVVRIHAGLGPARRRSAPRIDFAGRLGTDRGEGTTGKWTRAPQVCSLRLNRYFINSPSSAWCEQVYEQRLISNVERGAYIECMIQLALRERHPAWSLTETWDRWDLENQRPVPGSRSSSRQPCKRGTCRSALTAGRCTNGTSKMSPETSPHSSTSSRRRHAGRDRPAQRLPRALDPRARLPRGRRRAGGPERGRGLSRCAEPGERVR